MQIASSFRAHQSLPAKPVEHNESPQEAFPQDTFEPGWVSAGLSVAGGAVALAGAFADKPLMAAGGILVTAAATALTAKRVQTAGGLDSAAWVSMAGGGALTIASALVLAQPQPPAAPHGPLPVLLDRLGLTVF
jgi:hypothetical protein